MKLNIKKNGILIVDFGSQYSQLIMRRIREINVYCELVSIENFEASFEKLSPYGIILSGSAQSVVLNYTSKICNFIFNCNIPVLGICYGMHLMNFIFGGTIEHSDKREFGYSEIFIKDYCKIFDNIYDGFDKKNTPFLKVWMNHCDKIVNVPKNFKIIALSNFSQIAAIADENKKLYGVQFHPEVTQTIKGKSILKKFVFNICKCKSYWKSTFIIKNIINKIKMKVGKNNVILGLSGGIDSLVTALLLNKAINDKLFCIFIDNGFLRLGESDKIISIFKNKFKLNIIHIYAEDRFLKAISGVCDSELKRKVIGHMFVKIFEEESKKIKNVKWLAQGTIYPDVIESKFLKKGNFSPIKTHHNVGGLPNNIKFKLIEPLKYLFKDEVRKIGYFLKIPSDILYRHPFPGPGLSVRILGEVKKDICDLLRLADSIFIEELHKENLYYTVDQAFAVFLPIFSVGIMGEKRKYDRVISLRAIKSKDFMTATWAKLPSKFLNKVSSRIINEVDGISRVVYDITNKPPATIEWE